MKARAAVTPALTLACLPILAAACGGAGSPFGAVRGASHNCADQFAGAMVAKHAVVGTWDCLGSTVQDQFRTVGIEDDNGIARLAAKNPVYSRAQFMGRLSDGGYVYSMAGDASGAVLVVWLDRSGRVSDLQTAGRTSGGGQ